MEAALRFFIYFGFSANNFSYAVARSVDLTASLRYKTRALICGGIRYDKIFHNAASIPITSNNVLGGGKIGSAHRPADVRRFQSEAVYCAAWRERESES